jgi:predicted DNA-binding transcriptional regulator YafY
MVQEELCLAIQSRHLVQFYYTGNNAIGERIVEPHMVAYNRADNLALSAWYLSGYSESGEGQGWREYLLDEISRVTVLPEAFAGVRPGYKPDGGKTFHNVLCAL